MSKRPKHKLASAGKVSHAQAQESANTVYARSTDLEVLVRLKAYKPAVAQIDKLQLNLNTVRSHVSTSLKAKDRPRHWRGWSNESWGAGFLLGLLIGGLAVALLYNSYVTPQAAKSPAGNARNRTATSVSP